MFNMKNLLAVIIAGAFAGSVNADVLYTDGALDGNTNALQISNGYTVADTFSLSNASVLDSVIFDSWDAYAGDVTAIDWTIYSAAGAGAAAPAGTAIASGIQSSVTGSTLETNSQGYVVEANSFSLASLDLPAGTYWLELANASTVSTAPVYWDVNSLGSAPGASLAWTNQTGTFGASNSCGSYLAGMGDSCSNTFQISGSVVSAVPVPGAAWLFASGLAGFGAIRRLVRKA